MNTQKCANPNCKTPHTPLHRNQPICHNCWRTLQKNIAHITQNWEQLEQTLTPPHNPDTNPTHHTQPKPTPLPNTTTMQLRTKIAKYTHHWAHQLNTTPTKKIHLTLLKILTQLPHINPTQTQKLTEETQAITDQLNWILYAKKPKKITLQLPCTHQTPQGTPCPGTYTTHIWEQMNTLPDLTCNKNPEHKLSPSGYARPTRQKQLDTKTAIRLAHQIAQKDKK